MVLGECDAHQASLANFLEQLLLERTKQRYVFEKNDNTTLKVPDAALFARVRPHKF